MVKENIETVIDRILDFVNRSGKVPLGDAAAAVARPANQVEKLALLLEEKGLLEVHYEITGVKLSPPKRPQKEGEPNEGSKPDTAGTSPVIEEGMELEREVMRSESLLKFFENDLERRVNRAQEMLQLLEKSDYTAHELAETAKEIDMAIRQLEAFEKEIASLESKGTLFRKRLVAFKQKLAVMKPIKLSDNNAGVVHKNKVSQIIAAIIALFEQLKRGLQIEAITQKRQTPDKKLAPKTLAHSTELEKKKEMHPPMTVLANAPGKHRQTHSALKTGRHRMLQVRSDGVREHYWVHGKRKKHSKGQKR